MENAVDIIYRTLRESPAGLCILSGPEHVYTLVNPPYETLVGRSAGDLIGKRVIDVFPEVVGQGYIELLDGVIRTGEPFMGQERDLMFITDGAGGERHLHVDFFYQPMFGDTGAPEGIFVQATDVTHQVRARREVDRLASDLRDQRDRLQQVIDVIPEGFAIADATGAISHSNEEARRIWGDTALPGRPDEYAGPGLWAPDGRALDAGEVALARSLRDGEVVRGEQMFVGTPEGARTPILQCSAPLRDADGAIAGAVIAFSDISHLKALERQKDEFLGLVSHELRTPLTTIIGNSGALRRHRNTLDPEVIEAALQDIEADAQRLRQVVENMLALSRLESRPKFDLEPVLVSRLVSGVVEDHRARFPKREVVFSADEQASVVEAVPPYVVQVVANLLSNAEKYGLKDGPIEVAVSREGAMVVTRVLDRGKGVPAPELSHVFESFYRAAGSAQRAEGLGLGLAVCKRLIEAQDGRIWCSAREGGGSEFGFSLPLSAEE